MSVVDSNVPDAWPPPDETGLTGAQDAGQVVPLFPLPNFFLFPGTLMPLHIFEPRYRQMIEDVLDGPGRIAIGAVLEPWHDRLDGAPPVHDVGGLGEIARHERLPDGRFVILLAGLARVRIREVGTDRLYRKVHARWAADEPAPLERQDELRKRLCNAVRARTGPEQDLPEDLALGQLADLLLLRLQLPQASMQDLYSCLSVAERAERALKEHKRRPLPPRRSAQDHPDSKHPE